MKCLIVDDEDTARDAIRKMIELSGIFFQEIQMASNGMEAIDFIRAQRPEIVLTDMKMDTMSGTGLLKQIEEQPDPPQVIVISGYSDFEYTHSAISAGAADYLLKPIKQNDLNSAVMKAVRKIKNSGKSEMPNGEKSGKTSVTLPQVLLESEQAVEFVEQHPECFLLCCRVLRFTAFCLRYYNGNPEAVFYVLQSQMEERMNGIGHMFVHFHGDHYGSLLCMVSVQNQDEIHQLQNALNATIESIAIENQMLMACAFSDRIISPDQLSVAVYQVNSRIGMLSLTDEQNGVITGKEEKSHVLDSDEQEELSRLFLGEGIQEIADCIGRFLRKKLEKKQLTFSMADNVLNLLFTNIEDRIHCLQNQDVPGYLECSSIRSKVHNSLPDVEGIPALISEFLSPYGETLNVSSRKTISRILAYINENYQERITLTSLSNQFFISREHISRLFKKEKCCSFIKYLTELRLEHSAQLLRSTDLPLYEIVRNVGFTDSTYFIRVFKSKFRMTPIEYRNLKSNKY